MPRTVTTAKSREGHHRSINLQRTGDGNISIEIVIVEVDSENSIPESSRRVVLTGDDLSPAQRDNLLALFNASETRIRNVRYT